MAVVLGDAVTGLSRERGLCFCLSLSPSLHSNFHGPGCRAGELESGDTTQQSLHDNLLTCPGLYNTPVKHWKLAKFPKADVTFLVLKRSEDNSLYKD